MHGYSSGSTAWLRHVCDLHIKVLSEQFDVDELTRWDESEVNNTS